MEINNGVTLYTKTDCTNCTKMKRALDTKNVPYTEVPITPDIATWAKSEGVMQAPILTVEGAPKPWGGFSREGVTFAAEHFGGNHG